MIDVSDERFEELVDQALELVPEKFLDHLDNTVILIRDRHPDSWTILGLYEGVSLPERTSDYSMHLPDTISIFRESLKRYCDTEEELVEQVKITVIHEIGHHFGLSDEDLHRYGWG
ncbi:metallopeptidase family protein [Corynebacterium aquilae]|uniref:Metallopeptidase family protein n=1 Tax=Corynebacterium aquilae DSM 44791 TaxID=1431546 RepID=A0A1L7CIF0_9CORY|nr:metallopeptidase family protein [Corynebacterium aquilae]APT85642.1 hypothetical protein CAQU_11990 [Corynebacterium aquilae DSM 44791]